MYLEVPLIFMMKHWSVKDSGTYVYKYEQRLKDWKS